MSKEFYVPTPENIAPQSAVNKQCRQGNAVSSEFASEVWIPQGQLLRVGRLQATLEGNEETRIPWLSAIPLLGELFRWTSDTKAKSQVDVLMRIRPGVPIADSRHMEDSSETESVTLGRVVPVE
ncbi:MAG: hypothetical protein EOP09_06240 [Proteobacteria bacterium]|nr:MAG: hypothetical protein EOP09_06240 [Pseudomonadota bacterium]